MGTIVKKDVRELLGTIVKKENKRLEKYIIRKYCQIMYQKQAGERLIRKRGRQYDQRSN